MIINNFDGKYFFLSNFYAYPVEYEGITYPTNEHAFQAAKTLDIELRKKISKLATPGMSKSAGRKLLLRKDWEEVKYNVMYEIVYNKFNSDLGKKLIATGDAYLEEGNSWNDKIWGTCNGIGTNWLGKILMEVRSKLIDKI